MTDHRKNWLLRGLIWVFEGILVGLGAILPGISGGTLCASFGMYRPIIDVLSHFRNGMKKHWRMLGIFFIGVFIGFVGLSGFAAWLLKRSTVPVTCVFIGLILGTLPSLWRDAGQKGRCRRNVLELLFCFAAMLLLLLLFERHFSITVVPGIPGYFLCGLLWGLSFIIPGLSSSSLLLFFGLYQPMLEGISSFDLTVLLPMGLGLLACVLPLSKVIGLFYQRHYAAMSHGVIGILLATTVMILPPVEGGLAANAANLLCLLGGGAASFAFTRLSEKLSESKS